MPLRVTFVGDFREALEEVAPAIRDAAEALEIAGCQDPKGILEQIPDAWDLDCGAVVAAGRAGYRGLSAVRVALRLQVRPERIPSRPLRRQSRNRETRPRRHGASRSRAPDHLEGDDDPDPDPPACVVCGEPLTGARRHAQTCSGACRTRLYRQRRQADSLDLLGEAAIELVNRGELTPWEALAEVIFPSPQLRRMLEVAA